jgi:hypothetical protein
MISRSPVAWAAKKTDRTYRNELPAKENCVQVVIDNLNSQGLMTERNSLDDVRKKV